VLVARTPVGFLGVTIVLFAVVLGVMTVPSALMRGPELLEIDARYTSVSRGHSFVVWPTSDLDTVRLQDARHPVGSWLVGVAPGNGYSTGSVIWGHVGDGPSYGAAGVGLDESSGTAVLDAVRRFLDEHPADRSVRYVRGETLVSR